MSIKYLYLDLETGGLDYQKHPITQIACIVEVDGIEKERFSEYIDVGTEATLEPEALAITGYVQGAKGQLSSERVFRKFLALLERYVDPYDKKDKLYLVTYNGQAFDCNFLRKWFEDNGNKFYGAYTHFPSVDVMIMASGMCVGQRHKLGDFKLVTVATSLGVEVDKSALHEALYDVILTREIWKVMEAELIEN